MLNSYENATFNGPLGMLRKSTAGRAWPIYEASPFLEA
jgi:hypothetical protein